VNLVSGAAVVSGQASSGVLRAIFNNPYFALNGDVYINYIVAAAVGEKVLTPAGGNSLYHLARGEAPARAWAQYLGISFDARALLNSLSRLRFRTLADKELRMPFPYAPQMKDLAAYEIRIFGYPLLLFYKRGLLKDDLKAYDTDYAYGLLGRSIVVQFPTRESMEAEIRAGRMTPLGYVKVSDGKGGLRDSNLAVFAYQIPDGPHRGRTAMIIYGLKAFADYSATIDREVTRFREYERGLEEGLVLQQVVESEEADSLPSGAFEPRLHLGAGAIAKQFVPVLAPLTEWRRLQRRHELGLPSEPGEEASRARLRAELAARDIVIEEDSSDPLLGVQSEGSSFRYRAVVNGRRQVIQMTAIAGRAAIARDLKRLQEGRDVTELRRAAVSPGGGGVAFLNQVSEREGRLEVGPLMRRSDGPVLGFGIRTGSAELEPVFSAVEALPVVQRAGLQRRNFPGVILDLDADGDGQTERVALSFEFPVGEVRRTRLNPLTGESEIEVYQRGQLLRVVSAPTVVEISRDAAGLELGTRTFVNTGSLLEPASGGLLESTRTVERWNPDARLATYDPYAARLAKLRLNWVTGTWTREVYGLFPQPVEIASERWVVLNRFAADGRLESAHGYENIAADEPEDAVPPGTILRPLPGRERFEERVDQTNLEVRGRLLQVERRDWVTGQRTRLTLNPARGGRIEQEELVDPFDGSREFSQRSVKEYDDTFQFGQVPRRVRTTTESGRFLTDLQILNVDRLTRRQIAVERDFTGEVRTNTWAARWDRPIASETAARITVNRYSADGLSVTGTTQARDTGEEVARFAGRFEETNRVWTVARECWFRPGIL